MLTENVEGTLTQLEDFGLKGEKIECFLVKMQVIYNKVMLSPWGCDGDYFWVFLCNPPL